MNARHWWDLIIAGILTVMAAIAVQGYSGTSGRVGALVTLAAVGVAYLCGGRRALAASPVSPDADAVVMPATAGNIVFRVTLILACGVATAFDSNMATLQILAFPALWILAGSFRSAVLLNVALAGSTGIGLWLGLGGTADAAVQTVIIEGISLAFSLAMGIWISSIADAGTRQRRLLQELTAAQDELAAAHRDAGSASERERLAREIHDTIAQSLTSLVMIAQRTRSQLAELPGDTSAVADSVDLIESTGRDALTEARALVASMAPVQVGDADLAHTVARLAERFDRETGIRVAVDVDGLDRALDRALEVVLLRCAQEGLANVRKHSHADSAGITIRRTAEQIILTVTDDGRGLGDYHPDVENGFGLAGMRDRVALVGGRLDVTAGPDGTGTVLRVALPLPAAGAADAARPAGADALAVAQPTASSDADARLVATADARSVATVDARSEPVSDTRSATGTGIGSTAGVPGGMPHVDASPGTATNPFAAPRPDLRTRSGGNR
jgi:signal transduction histidine kinase